MEILQKVKATVKLRRDIGGVRPNAEQIDGKTFNFYVGWLITEDDTPLYAGEYALLPDDDESYPRSAPQWIASGDVEVTQEAE